MDLAMDHLYTYPDKPSAICTARHPVLEIIKKRGCLVLYGKRARHNKIRGLLY